MRIFGSTNPPRLPAQPPIVPGIIGGWAGRVAERAQKMRSMFWIRRKRFKKDKADNP
jgi:hypothetical protein